MNWWARRLCRQGLFPASTVVFAALSADPQPVACHTAPCVGTASLGANLHNEDRFRVVQQNNTIVATVADGHGSGNVSQFVVDHLASEIFIRLPLNSFVPVDQVVSAFLHVDNLLREVVYGGSSIRFHEGSCAITAVVTEDQVLVANCGDSRGLLIRGSESSPSFLPILDEANSLESCPPNAEWVSRLFTADSALEQDRLRSLHPSERDVVHCRQKIVELEPSGAIASIRWAACYVKGRLQPTKAFGDFYLKDAKAIEFCPELVPHIDSGFTPPYIDVVPSCVSLERRNGDILILASDGLWDYVSPAVVADVVRSGIENQRTPDLIAGDLIEAALEIAAEATGGEVSLDQLKSMAPGVEKRSIHDDITVVVVAM